jgi:hypothetical protein
MNKFITISIIILSLSTSVFASSSVQDRMQQKMQEVDEEELSECAEKLERYTRKVKEFAPYAHFSRATPQRWKYEHYTKRLKQWTALCS